jgi:hypothetical protein
MNMGYAQAMFHGADIRSVWLGVIAAMLLGGVLWAFARFVFWCVNFVRTVRCLQRDVNGHGHQLSKLLSHAVQQRNHSASHRPSYVPPAPLPIIHVPPPLPTVGAEDWADDDDRPSAATQVKSS